MIRVYFAPTAKKAVEISQRESQRGQGWVLVLAIWPIVLIWRRK